jgi:hypothetical protein
MEMFEMNDKPEEYKIIDPAQPNVLGPISPEKKAMEKEMLDAPELDFDVTGEHWVRIEVSDGADLRLKTIVSGVKRLSDDPISGEARYVIKSQSVIRIAKKGTKDGAKEENPGMFKRR